MSRTYRKKGHQSQVEYLVDALDCYHCNSTRLIKVRKTEAAYKADLAKADAEFDEAHRIAKCSTGLEAIRYRATGRTVIYDYRGYKVYDKRIVRDYYYVDVPITYDDIIKEAKNDYARLFYDGHWSETNCNTGYKNASKKSVRRKNKKLCSDIMRGEDYDIKSYPDYDMEKRRFWDWW